MGNTFGRVFRVTTFGESHGGAVGVVVDGCPPRLPLSEADIQPQLDRRRPGQHELSSGRHEPDRIHILSGVDNGQTLGTPIAMVVANRDARPEEYQAWANIPRPSHADWTYRVKYGVVASSGGGRASARETVARVAAGAVAEKWLATRGITIVAWVSAVGRVQAPDLTSKEISREGVDRSPVRCPDETIAARMVEEIRAVLESGDSVGGVVTCVCRGVPAGWGEPVFDKAHALLAHAMMSIPAARGFECGAGFAAAEMRGSEHNDLFCVRPDGHLGTRTNRSGGIQGGITNGEPIVFRVAFKPPATLRQPQSTVDYQGQPVTLAPAGRHDPCVVPRAVPVVEAMAALVLADLARLASW